MLTKKDLPNALYKTLKVLGGKATLLVVCKTFYGAHENELRNSGDLFYTWQYDIRWAATELRKTGRMVDSDESPKGLWQIKR